ncbi:hypothetical protein GL325_11220 [Aeromicrobium sp. 636]|uniref:GNAT family N-acetyltransferase n=1 Tax=Aeromicrobium senzhongii TaxID=2663859 RepID=A0A8I0K372_9ACTN|nr:MULTISPECIES: hypothetical protein [Aeromicrobium]MBC9226900.1 hypothetical protein [Aeromicrobium senzhongii]MCQ3999000.1 hypothetical protein [Aeromicrobium sp. 636]
MSSPREVAAAELAPSFTSICDQCPVINQCAKSQAVDLAQNALGHANGRAAHRRSRLTLDVAENCSSAIALYGQLGWRLTGKTPIDWGEDVADCLLHFEAPPP